MNVRILTSAGGYTWLWTVFAQKIGLHADRFTSFFGLSANRFKG